MSIKEIKIADKETLDEVKTLLESMRSTQVVSLEVVGDVADDNMYNSEVSTLPYNFSGGATVIYNNEIHILGGTDNKSYTRHYKWNGTKWTRVSTLPIYGVNGHAVVYNDEIHIIPDYSSTGHYKWNGTEWIEVSTMPYNSTGGRVVVYNDEIHIIIGNGTAYHYKYDGTEWTEVSTLPYNFNNGSVVVYNNEIHIMGAETQHYKWNGTEWIEVSTLPYNFWNGSAVVYNDEIHILGGNYDIVYHYKWDGIKWTKTSNLPYIFDSNDAVVYNDEIHILGGGKYVTTSNNVFKKHYKLYKKYPKQMPDIYLPKGTNMYSPDGIEPISNCTLATDHLVVTEDGIVSFATFTKDTKSIITLC